MVRNKLAIAKNYNIPPSEIDALQFWEYEYYLDEINNEVEEEKRRQEKEKAEGYPGFKPGDFKMPDYSSSFKMPSFDSSFGM